MLSSYFNLLLHLRPFSYFFNVFIIFLATFFHTLIWNCILGNIFSASFNTRHHHPGAPRLLHAVGPVLHRAVQLRLQAVEDGRRGKRHGTIHKNRNRYK